MSILIKEIGLQKKIYKNTVKVCMIGSGLKTLMKSGDKNPNIDQVNKQ